MLVLAPSNKRRQRTVYLLFDLSPEVNRNIEHFDITQSHCPKW